MTSSTSTTTYSRGDVVIVRWPNKYTQIVKARPALVVQSDAFRDDDAMIVLVPMTSEMRLPLLNCRIPVLLGTEDHAAINTRGDSLILPEKVLHVPRSDIHKTVGRCPAALMQRVEAGLRFVLGL